MSRPTGDCQALTDAEHAVVSACYLTAATATEVDGGFSDADIEAWMETAVDPIDTDE